MVAAAHPTSPTIKELNEVAREVPASLVTAVTRLMGTVGQSEEQAGVVARVLTALARSAADLKREDWAVEDERSDYAVLVGWLNRPEVLADLRRSAGAMTVARLRGLAVKERLLAAEGGTWSSSELAAALGISRQAVDARRRRGALIGVALGKRCYSYPCWQVGLEGLTQVLVELRGYDPWAHLAFMLTPNVWLADQTPLAALRQGQVDQAVDAARTYGQQTAA